MGVTRTLVVGSLFLLAGCLNRAEPEPILVGQVAPFNGPDKYVGDHVTQGLTLAAREANDEGDRVLGRKVEVITPDGRGADDVGRKAVRLVVTDRVAALLGGTEPAQIEALAPVARSYHVPVVSTAGLADTGGNDFVFQTGLSPALQGL